MLNNERLSSTLRMMLRSENARSTVEKSCENAYFGLFLFSLFSHADIYSDFKLVKLDFVVYTTGKK